MHDISSDLKGRAERLKAEIGAENARFEHLLQQLRAKQEVSLQPLRAQLRLAQLTPMPPRRRTSSNAS